MTQLHPFTTRASASSILLVFFLNWGRSGFFLSKLSIFVWIPLEFLFLFSYNFIIFLVTVGSVIFFFFVYTFILRFFKETGLQASGLDPGITLDAFKNGFTLLAFDLTADRTPEDARINLVRQGKVTISMRFGTALPHPVSVICLSSYDNLIQLTADRLPVTDFTMS